MHTLNKVISIKIRHIWKEAISHFIWANVLVKKKKRFFWRVFLKIKLFFPQSLSCCACIVFSRCLLVFARAEKVKSRKTTYRPPFVSEKVQTIEKMLDTLSDVPETMSEDNYPHVPFSNKSSKLTLSEQLWTSISRR